MSELKGKITITDDDKVSMFISRLFHSQTQVHIFHLQTNSFAAHKALEEYYEGIDGLTDQLAEIYQGEFKLILNYKSDVFMNYDKDSSIGYFKNLLKYIKENRETFKGTDYQNTIDEITALIKSTLYKLTKLT